MLTHAVASVWSAWLLLHRQPHAYSGRGMLVCLAVALWAYCLCCAGSPADQGLCLSPAGLTCCCCCCCGCFTDATIGYQLLLLCLAKLCPRANCPTESSRAPRHIKQAMHCSTMGQLLHRMSRICLSVLQCMAVTMCCGARPLSACCCAVGKKVCCNAQLCCLPRACQAAPWGRPSASCPPGRAYCIAGRAGSLGLAISLVATVPEKVWYCSQKGYKPWLKPKSQDVRTNEQGGHTIWYNEPELLQVGQHVCLHTFGSGAACSGCACCQEACSWVRMAAGVECRSAGPPPAAS